MTQPLYDIDRSYEANEPGPAYQPPPVSEEIVAADLERRLFGVPVGYPIGVPASPLTANSAWIKAYADLGFNVLTYKTVRSETTSALPPPNWLFADGLERPLPAGEPIAPVRVLREQPDATAYSMINSCGIPSTAPPDWQEDIRRSLEVLRPGQLLIVSVVGDYEELSGKALIDDFVRVALLVEQTGARVIELNLSCPNSVSTRGDGLRAPICESEEDTCKIVVAVRSALKPATKLVAKLGYLRREKLEYIVTPIAERLDGIAGINTLQVDIKDGPSGPVFVGTLRDPDEPRRQAGLSGVAIRDHALDFVRSLALLRRKHDWRFAIIGMGGVMEPHDVRALMASGADAVQTATAAHNNPHLPTQLWDAGHPVPSEDERLVGLLEAALMDQKWRFRTVDGLANELRLSPECVRKLLESHPDVARRSVMRDRNGSDLYAADDRQPTLRERLEQVRWLLAR